MTEVDVPEPQQQEENPEDVRPDWLPDKFKTPEDLAKSYGELESKLGQTTQQMREQQQQWEEFLQQQEAEKQSAQQQERLPQAQEQLYAAYEQDPLSTLAWMSEQAASRAVQQALQQQAPMQQQQLENAALVAGDIAERAMAARYDDWATYKDAAVKEIEDNLDLYPEQLFSNPAGVEKVFDRAYRAVKLEALTTGQATLEEQQAAANQTQKVNAQTISGSAGRPETPNDDEEFYARLSKAAKQTYSGWRGNP